MQVFRRDAESGELETVASADGDEQTFLCAQYGDNDQATLELEESDFASEWRVKVVTVTTCGSLSSIQLAELGLYGYTEDLDEDLL